MVANHSNDHVNKKRKDIKKRKKKAIANGFCRHFSSYTLQTTIGGSASIPY